MCEMKQKDEWNQPSKERKQHASHRVQSQQKHRGKKQDLEETTSHSMLLKCQVQDRERGQVKQRPDLEGLSYIRLGRLNFILQASGPQRRDVHTSGCAQEHSLESRKKMLELLSQALIILFLCIFYNVHNKFMP